MVLHGDTDLVRDVWPRLADVSTHLSHHAYVIVAVEKSILLFPASRASTGAVRRLVCLKRGIAQDHDEALGVFVVAWYGDMLFCDELGQVGWRERLRSWGS
jgi:hypothetical protein